MSASERLAFCVGVSGSSEDLDQVCLAMEDRAGSAEVPMIAWRRSNDRGYRVLVLAPLLSRNAVRDHPRASFVSLADGVADMTEAGASLITHDTASAAQAEWESWRGYAP